MIINVKIFWIVWFGRVVPVNVIVYQQPVGISVLAEPVKDFFNDLVQLFAPLLGILPREC